MFCEKLEKFRFCFFCGWYLSGGRFTHFWPRLSGSGHQPNEPIFWLKISLETRL